MIRRLMIRLLLRAGACYALHGLALVLFSGCTTDEHEDRVVPVELPDLVPVQSRLEIVCGPPPAVGCIAVVVCRDCDPETEECEAWQGACSLFEEPGQ